MAKYVYPAIFTNDEDGYSVDFPDINGCYTCGKTLEEAMFMADDALALMLYHYEEEKRDIPAASDIRSLKLDDNSFASYINCDTLGYRKRYNNKSVKKTLSIPEWLNEYAMAANINFSQVLQDALKKQLNVI